MLSENQGEALAPNAAQSWTPPAKPVAHFARRHRADIDGLRAVAVIPILLFHAGFSTFDGGFVGVDVFFVVSGYLITSIVLDDIEAGRFSIIAFYERRIRRIFPALFAMILASVVAGVLIFVPEDLKDIAQGGAAAALSASNLLFWYEAGYFDVAAERKPLLHTWSLAVEEQFYLAFPLILMLLSRLDRSRVRMAVAALLLSSFVLATWSIQQWPMAAFYLAPTRAWELLIGAFLTLGVVQPPRHQRVRDGLALLGAGMITYSVFAFSGDTPFPGVAALVPCLGTCLVIHAGTGGRSLIGRVLGAPPIAWIGLISYSLYLWHWPLLTFARYYAIRELTGAEALMIILLTVPIAIASWWWIERPFRGPRPFLDRAMLFKTAGIAMGITLALGSLLHLSGGLPLRMPAEANRLAAGTRDRSPSRALCTNLPLEAARAGSLCRIGAGGMEPSTFLLWGDSHAETLRAAIGEVATQAGRAGVFAGQTGCPPLLGLRVWANHNPTAQACRDFNEAIFAVASGDNIDTVILAAHWSLYATGRHYRPGASKRTYLSDDRTEPQSVEANEAVFRRGLENTATALAAAGKNVVIVAPVPEVGLPVPQTLALVAWHRRDIDIRPLRESFDARNHTILSILGDLKARSLAEIVYPHAILCDDGRCSIESNGRALYTDDNHLSLYGASLIKSLLVEVL